MDRKYSFKQILEEQSLTQSHKTAIKYKNQQKKWSSVSWSGLYERSQAAARGLAKLGLKSGQCLAVLSENSIDWEILFYAGMFNGSIVLGVDLHAAEEQKWDILKRSGARVLAISETTKLSSIPESVLTQLQYIILLSSHLDSENSPQVLSLQDLVRMGSQLSSSIEASPETAGLLIYTSGTTGSAKGVLYSQRQVLEAAYDTAEVVGPVSQKDRLLCWLPVANLFQRMMNIGALVVGAPNYLIAHPQMIMQELPVVKPTIFIGVPRFYERLVEGIQDKIHSLPKILRPLMKPLIGIWVRRALGGEIRLMISGSAPLSPSVLSFFESIKLPLLEAYGMSENILPIAMNRPGKIKAGSVGQILPKNKIKLTEDGELLVKGPGMAQNYFRSEDLSRWDQEGFFRTGDQARIDSEGYVYLLGRKSDLIKLTSGRRISPLRIEESLKKVALVDHAIVIGHGRKSLAAIIALKCKIESLSEEEIKGLRISLREATRDLSSYEQVRKFLILKEEMTIQGGHLTANLKIKRAALEKMYSRDIEALYREEMEEQQVLISTTSQQPLHP